MIAATEGQRSRTVIRDRPRSAIRWAVSLVVVGHGLLHLLGAAKGLGWADTAQLTDSISTPIGMLWLAASLVTTISGALLALRIRWWWVAGAAAIPLSQTAIFTSWGDAKAGTIPNVLLLGAVIYGFASQGPHGAHAEYQRRASNLAPDSPSGLVTEADLSHLPAPVAAYVRRSGAVGQPPVSEFAVQFHGRIRGGPAKPWMTFTGQQTNTAGLGPVRLFFMDAALFGIPIEVLHVFDAGTATMRVRACSLFTMVNASGAEMDRGETVTVFNDMCVLAPAMLIDAPVTWILIDDQHVRGTYTCGPNSVSAELTFNDDHELVNFVSDDRFAGSSDGKSFAAQRWSTPISNYRTVNGHHLGTFGLARWHAPSGEYTYLEFNLDTITYNVAMRARCLPPSLGPDHPPEAQDRRYRFRS